MHLETKISTTDAAPATATLNGQIKAILMEYNQRVLECETEHRLESPEDVFEDTAPATVADVVQCLSATRFVTAHGLWSPISYHPIDDIVEAIAKQIAADDYDPWPELTMEELRFLIGDRAGSANCPYPLNVTVRCSEDRPLTFMERVCADRHREWLEKGVEAKRKRLKKAQAAIAKLVSRPA